MKIRMEKGKAAGIVCAAVIMLTAAFFCAHFYRNSPREIPDPDVSRYAGESAELTGLAEIPGGNGDGTGQGGSEDNESLSAEVSHEPSQKPQDAPEKENTNNDAEKTPVSSADTSATDGKKRTVPADIHSAAQEEGTKAEGEFFTASIKDGETVTDKNYSFTVTQLDDTLVLRGISVMLGGREIKQFSGSCLLEEGKNVIRITCSYTEKSGAVRRVYRDYTVYLKTGEISIKTDLSDTETDREDLTFDAKAYCGTQKLPLRAEVNGREVTENGSYTVKLSEGENSIRLYAEKNGISAEKVFTVRYSPVRTAEISTDLYDRTVTSDSFGFYAVLNGGGGSGRLNVQLNGKTLRGENGSFECTLKEGENTVRLTAKYSGGTLSESYTVIYAPPVTEEQLPSPETVNITDGMTVKGSLFPLSLCAVDGWGNRIYSDGITVTCAGSQVNKSWEDYGGTGYNIPLSPGENGVLIRLEDSFGRQRDFYYVINCVYAGEGEEIGRISINLGADRIGLPSICSDEYFPVYEGENGFDVLCRFLSDNGFETVSDGSDQQRYISRIQREGAFSGGCITAEALDYLSSRGISLNGVSFPDSLGEFDYTQGSGWIYVQNGKVPSYGISDAHFSDGDTVSLEFSLDYGNDIRSE